MANNQTGSFIANLRSFVVASVFTSIAFACSGQPTQGVAPATLIPEPFRPLPIQQTPDPAADSATTPGVLNVLDYLRSHLTHETIDDLEQDHSGYNRRDDFGGWIVRDENQGCLDTRGEVLIRSADPSAPIKYRDSRKCSVTKGLWHEPYAGVDYKLAKAMQIDHVVPLKHVYVTGGYAWSAEKRCYYANFLHNDFHLLAVSGHENMSKGDKAPDQYLPPNDAFQCQYVANWMKVKAIWQLVATDAELQAIENVIQTHHCSEAKLEYAEADLDNERRAIDESIPERCVDFAQDGAPSFRQMAVPPPPAPEF
jgi:hypothetical protein